jgi:hypothetical protein
MNAYPEKDGQLVPKWKPTVKGGLKVSRGPLERRYISRAFPDGCENIQALSVSPFTTTPFLPFSVVSLRLFRTWCWFCIFELSTLTKAWAWWVPHLDLIMALAERIDDLPLASSPCIQSGVLSVKEFAWAFSRASVRPVDTRSRCCAFPHNVHIPIHTACHYIIPLCHHLSHVALITAT